MSYYISSQRVTLYLSLQGDASKLSILPFRWLVLHINTLQPLVIFLLMVDLQKWASIYQATSFTSFWTASETTKTTTAYTSWPSHQGLLRDRLWPLYTSEIVFLYSVQLVWLNWTQAVWYIPSQGGRNRRWAVQSSKGGGALPNCEEWRGLNPSEMGFDVALNHLVCSGQDLSSLL